MLFYLLCAGGKPNPGNDTTLVLHSDRHAAALFKFDQESKEIIHKSGKIWHPKGGSTNPGNDTTCVLHSDRHAGAKFLLADRSGKPLDPTR